MPSPVCIVGGTGALGFGLAVRLGVGGASVVIGSRDAERAREAAVRASEAMRAAGTAPHPDAFRGSENPDAVAGAEIVVIAVPFASQAQTLRGLGDVLTPEQVVVDATVPLAVAVGGRPRHVLGVWQGSAAQQAQSLVPEGVRVVSAFHTVNAAQLADLGQTLDEDVLVAGDRRTDKARVLDLVQRIPGLRPVDVGPLEMARYAEQLTPLLISVNARHKVRAGVRITGLAD